jgi:acyl-CoA synthetase (NDP forming)
MMERPGPGSIAILSQSGTYGATLLEWFAQEGLGVSKFASYGNRSDVDEVDLAGYLADDPDTGIMVFYVEGMQRPREFFGLAGRIGPKKPVLMLKGARTAAGARAAASHTGSIAGQFGSFSGAMAQCGVLLAEDSEELFDMAKLLCLQPFPAGGRIMMVTNGAGPCVIASDLVSESRFLSLARLGGPGADSLRKALPPFCVVGNPVDLTGSAEAGHFLTALEAVAADPAVDIILPVLVFQDAPLGLSAGGLAEAVRKVMAGGKTMAAVAGGGSFTRLQAARLQKAGMPVFPSARRAVRALEGVVRHSLWRGGHRKIE